jgi:hypothetical protein
MMLLAKDWDRACKLTPWWTVAIDGSGKHKQVTAGRIPPGRFAQQADETHPRMTLARFLTKCSPGMVVCYRDGDFLNLCLDNLEVITRAALRERVGDMLRWLPTAKAILKETGERPPSTNTSRCPNLGQTATRPFGGRTWLACCRATRARSPRSACATSCPRRRPRQVRLKR